jgi:hypothetical protein
LSLSAFFFAKMFPPNSPPWDLRGEIAIMAMFNIACCTVPNDSPNWKHHPHTLLNGYPAGAVIS